MKDPKVFFTERAVDADPSEVKVCDVCGHEFRSTVIEFIARVHLNGEAFARFSSVCCKPACGMKAIAQLENATINGSVGRPS